MSAAALGVSDAKHTSEMRVYNTGFLIDRMGKDCHPLQFLRELTQNSIEAVLELPVRAGEVVWDVDWNEFDLTGIYKLACIDTGVGMTGPEMVEYINQLSISTREQAHDKNFGIGAKVAAAMRNHAGLLYLSWKDGKGSMIHVWRDPLSGQYGIRRQQRSDDSWHDWVPISDDVKPAQIGERETMVVLMGNDMDLGQDTMQPPEGVASPTVWVARYLNTRYFRFAEGVTVKARQGWKEPRSNTSVNVLRTARRVVSFPSPSSFPEDEDRIACLRASGVRIPARFEAYAAVAASKRLEHRRLVAVITPLEGHAGRCGVLCSRGGGFAEGGLHFADRAAEEAGDVHV